MHSGYHIRISVKKPAPPPSTSSSFQPVHLDTTSSFVPNSLFQTLPAHPPRSTARRYTIQSPRQPAVHDSGRPHQDYRFGPLRVDWVDFNHMDLDGAKKASTGKEKQSFNGGGPASASFITTGMKSGTTNLPEGVVHIFRQTGNANADRTHTYSAVATAAVPTSAPAQHPTEHSNADPDNVLMGVLAVPSWMTPSDFLGFVAPASEGMAHLRMIRDTAPNRSIVVIKFRDANDAAEFAEAYNGKQFNSMEPEICHVVRVLSVEVDANDDISQAITRIASTQGDAYELPTCPVCLERMDSAVTGLVTVPCSHTFHCACLSKWGDSRCPVCRYSQTLLSSHPTSANTSRSSVPIPFTSSSQSSHCVDCPSDTASNSNLWICLICGNIGCGRYRRAHAQAHYEQTTHLYALELETQRVWDYAGDGYVHRLIQNKADGKLVELPSAASAMNMGGVTGSRDGRGPSEADALSAEKIEAIGIEYSYLLTSQLDSQRTYYETEVNDLRSQVNELKTLFEGVRQEIAATRTRAQTELDQQKQTEEARISELEKARLRAEKRADKFSDLARALEKELKGERGMSEGLLKNLEAAKERAEKAEQEKEVLKAKVAELEDQVRDIMFFVEAREKIEQGEGTVGEAAGGSVAVPTPPPTNGSKKKGRKR